VLSQSKMEKGQDVEFVRLRLRSCDCWYYCHHLLSQREEGAGCSRRETGVISYPKWRRVLLVNPNEQWDDIVHVVRHHKCTQTHTQAKTNVGERARTHTYTHTHTCRHTHTYTHVYTRVRARAHTHTHTHTHLADQSNVKHVASHITRSEP
jgi:hypothetical protein